MKMKIKYAQRIIRFTGIILALLIAALPGDDTTTLQPIPESSRGVTVVGEVQQPSIIPYREGITLMDCIEACRGFTDDSNPSKALLIRNGKITHLNLRGLGGFYIDGKFHKNARVSVSPGDVIFVARKEDAEAREKTENDKG